MIIEILLTLDDVRQAIANHISKRYENHFNFPNIKPTDIVFMSDSEGLYEAKVTLKTGEKT